MKLKKIFALALAVCMVLAAAPAVLANGVLTLGNGNASTTLVEEQTSVQTPVRTTARTTARNFTPIDHKAVETTKVVTPNDDGTYTITLESWVTGSSVTTSTTSAKPTDIVLVLDYSASMSNDSNNTNINNLRAAAKTFIDKVAENSTAENEHRIALITFGSAGSSYTNTDLYIGKGSSGADSKGFVNYSKLIADGGNAYYKNAFISANNSTQVGYMKDSLSKGVSGLTAVDLGMAMAKNVLTENSLAEGEQRNRVVIVFTDGEPTHSGNGYDSGVATAAINTADSIKDSGVKVYSIGLFDSADETVAPTDNFNTFLHNISSNETYPQTPSYYYAAKNSSKLSNIFTGIASSVTSGGAGNTTLNSETVLQDVISEYFVLPEGTQTSDIKVYTADYNGPGPEDFDDRDEWVEWTGAKKEISSDGKTITVSNFNYVAEDNWVGSRTAANGKVTYAGKKLIVEFVVQPKAGFLGGNDVPTNAPEQSGLYKVNKVNDEEIIEWAEQFPNNYAKADVLVSDITVTAEDKNVYLLGTVTEGQMLENATATVNGATLDLDAANYGLAAWQYEFVDIAVSAQIDTTDSAFDGTADGKYIVSCSITSKTNKQNTKEGSAKPNINVFKPTLTYPDYTFYLGNDPVIAPTSTVWKHGDTVAPASMGDAPALTGHAYSWTSGSDACNENVTLTDVSIATADGNVSVKDHVIANTFKVHVLQPVIASTDQTIYLSRDAELNAKVDSWKCTCKEAPKTAAYKTGDPTPTYVYKYADPTKGTDTFTSNKPAICTDYKAVATLSGKTFEGNTFTVHVVNPTIEDNSAAIKLGVAAPLNADNAEITWKDKCECTTNAPDDSSKPSLAVNYYLGNDQVSDTTYPVTCKDYTKKAVVGGSEYADITGVFTVHVHEPIITGKPTTIYLGNSTTLNANDVTLTWEEKCTTHNGNHEPSGTPAPTYKFAGEGNSVDVAPVECTDYNAVLTKIGGVTPANNKYKTDITVHVVYPIVTTQDVTIYLGDTPTYVTPVVTWDTKCENGDANVPNGMDDAPEYKFAYSPKAAAFNTCTDVNVTVYMGEMAEDGALGNANYTDFTQYVTFKNGTEDHKGNTSKTEFKVHVLKPEISFQDTYIYRGNSADFSNNYLAANTTWVEAVNHGKTTEDAGTIPTVTPSYDEKASAFTTCNDVNVTGIKIGENVITSFEDLVVMKNGSDTRGKDKVEFTVHVLQPTFTVETQDVWADYTNDVDLTAKGIKSSELVWKDQTTGHTTPTSLPAGAPTVSTKTFTFDKGTSGKYTVGTSDETVTVSKLTFALNNGYSADYTLEDKTFTIHVNKFDLTINKTWNGADIYKQDAIFTVSGGLGDFKVVLPAGQSSIEVTGLLCGQDYTVSEDDAWTWRWNSSSQDYTVAKTETKHDVSTSDPHDAENGNHNAQVSFTNSLVKEFWLSFCTFVQNIFGQTAIQKGGN